MKSKLKYCRINIAIDHLNQAVQKNGLNKRKLVISALWNLIRWVVGDESIPTPNAVSCEDDNSKYCDMCFRTKTKFKLTTINFMDLCPECLLKHPQYTEDTQEVRHRRDKEDKQTIRIHKDLDHIEKEKKRIRTASKDIKIGKRVENSIRRKKPKTCLICNDTKRIVNTILSNDKGTIIYRLCPGCQYC